jgi:hypothetical protein
MLRDTFFVRNQLIYFLMLRALHCPILATTLKEFGAIAAPTEISEAIGAIHAGSANHLLRANPRRHPTS